MGNASTSGQCSRVSGESLDSVFTALADEQRRQVLLYFQTVDDDVASVQELISYALEGESDNTSREQLAVTFHHVTLPKLADLEIIEYDARTRTVRYRGSPVLERALTVAVESGDSTELH